MAKVNSAESIKGVFEHRVVVDCHFNFLYRYCELPLPQ